MRRPTALGALLLLLAYATRISGGTPFATPDYRVDAPALVHDGAMPWPEDPNATLVHVHVSNVTLGHPSPYHFGINVPDFIPKKWFSDHATGLLKDGGFKFLRFPGGSDADTYIWNQDFETFSYFKQFDGGAAYYPPVFIGTDDFIDICKEIGAEPLLQLNYAAFIMTGEDEALELAVSWLRYFESHGLPVRYAELGNENYGGWEMPQKFTKDTNITGDRYGRHLQRLSQRLRAEQLDVYVGAVVEADGCPECHEWAPGHTWMKGLTPYLEDGADYLSYHNYFLKNYYEYGWSWVNTTQLYRVASANTVPVIRENVEKELRKYGGPHLPMALTEWNVELWLDDWPDKHGSALAVADIQMRMMASDGGFEASNFFSLVQVDGRMSLGLAAKGDPDAADGTPRPVWYSFAIMRRVVGDRLITATVVDNASPTVSTDHFADKEQNIVHERRLSAVEGAATVGELPPPTINVPAPNISVYASTFSSGEASLLLINRQTSNASVCVTGLEGLGVEDWRRIRGWVLSPHSEDLDDPAQDYGSKWNGVKQVNDVGGPYPVDNIKAYELLVSSRPECQAVIDIPGASVVGAVFFTTQSKWADVPSTPLLSGWMLVAVAAMAVCFIAFIVTQFCRRLAIRRMANQKPTRESSLPLWLSSKLTSSHVPDDGLSRPARAQIRVQWTHLFTVRIGYTLFFLFLTASNVLFLAWLFADKSSFAWNEVCFIIADALGSLSAASYLLCGCFYPHQPEPVLTDKQLLELGRTEHAAVVQCHYNEPTEDILSALRYNLKHFQEFGCSRASRKYYICDDGFYTGSGDEQRLRQMAFCRELRGVVREVLGEKPGFEDHIGIGKGDLTWKSVRSDGRRKVREEDEEKEKQGANANREPLALAEGSFVDASDILRADCAEGFLIWCVGRPEDHVYLVARKKPPAHHAKAGNINNFLYNVLRHQYAPDGVLRLANGDGPPPNYVLLLDQDMCLGHEFVKAQPYYRPVEVISMALPVMEADLRRTAFVQFPQHFFDMHRNDVTFNSNATFYNGVELGRGAVGLASFSGTNCVWDISKLFSIGGLQYGSVTEDANTAMVAQRLGFRSRYVDAPVAAGNSPQTVEAVVKQVCARWALGSIEMLFQRCGCSTRPERLCDDQFRVPPPGLKDAYGYGEYDHFDAAQKNSMRRGCLEWTLMHIFCAETMVFPFWSFGALLHMILACNFLLTLAPPLKFNISEPSTTELPGLAAHSAVRSATWPIYVLLAHAMLNTLAPLFAFPRVRVKDMLRSMCAWVGLAPTMITHAVLKGVWEKIGCCKSKAKPNWTSIRDGSNTVYTPVFMILFCGLLLASLMVFRSVECIAAPDAPELECPSAGSGLPDWADQCDCGWAYGTPWNDLFQAGGNCHTTEDDFSVCRCFCCCDYVGECGHTHVHEKHTLRAVGTPGPCNEPATVMAVLYGGLLLALLSPWLYAVLRDLRKIGRPRSFYEEGSNGDPLTELAQKIEVMTCTSSGSDVNIAGAKLNTNLMSPHVQMSAR